MKIFCTILLQFNSKSILTLILSSSLLMALGQSTFQKSIGDKGVDRAHDMVVLPDGNIIIAGRSVGNNSDPSNLDILLTKTDNNGNLIWSKTYGGPGTELAMKVLPTADKGFILLAEKYRENNQEGEFLILVKTDSRGNLEWKKVIHEGEMESEGYSIKEVTDGYIISGLLGKLSTISDIFFTMKNESQRLYLIKIDRSGNKMWSHELNVANSRNLSTSGLSLVVESDGGFTITGISVKEKLIDPRIDKVQEDEIYPRKMLMVNADAQGNISWMKEYSGDVVTMGYVIRHKPNGGYILGGITNTKGTDNMNILLVDLSSDGTVNWANSYGGSKYEAISDMNITQDGAIVVTGLTRSYGGGVNDALFFKTSSNGDLIWAKAFGGRSSDMANAVQELDDGYLFAGDFLSITEDNMNVYLVKTDLNGNTNCNWEYDAPLEQISVDLNYQNITGASLNEIKPEPRPGSDFKRIDISKVTENQVDLPVKDICNK